jgi:hypothetical protein
MTGKAEVFALAGQIRRIYRADIFEHGSKVNAKKRITGHTTCNHVSPSGAVLMSGGSRPGECSEGIAGSASHGEFCDSSVLRVVLNRIAV